jgi:hypothetical protein
MIYTDFGRMNLDLYLENIVMIYGKGSRQLLKKYTRKDKIFKKKSQIFNKKTIRKRRMLFLG